MDHRRGQGPELALLVRFASLPDAGGSGRLVGMEMTVVHEQIRVAMRRDRIHELRKRGFDSATISKWVDMEDALGREVCYHVAVGVPEMWHTGMCATCWTPAMGRGSSWPASVAELSDRTGLEPLAVTDQANYVTEQFAEAAEEYRQERY